MNTKLFGAISLEEAAFAAEPITIETVMSIEDLETDVTIAAETVSADLEMINSAMEVSDAMDAQIAVESAILATGVVPVGVAQMAAVSLQNNAKMLGMDATAVAISAESIEQSPTTALKVALEEKEGTFALIIKKIKEMFSKLWSNVKKLAAKELAFIGGYKKKFEALAKAADELDKLKEGDKGELTKSECRKIGKKFYNTMAVNNDKLTVDHLIATMIKSGDNSGTLLNVMNDVRKMNLDNVFQKEYTKQALEGIKRS